MILIQQTPDKKLFPLKNDNQSSSLAKKRDFLSELS